MPGSEGRSWASDGVGNRLTAAMRQAAVSSPDSAIASGSITETPAATQPGSFPVIQNQDPLTTTSAPFSVSQHQDPPRILTTNPTLTLSESVSALQIQDPPTNNTTATPTSTPTSTPFGSASNIQDLDQHATGTFTELSAGAVFGIVAAIIVMVMIVVATLCYLLESHRGRVRDRNSRRAAAAAASSAATTGG